MYERMARGRNEKGSNGIEKTVIGASNLHIFRKKLVAKVMHYSLNIRVFTVRMTSGSHC